MSFGVWQPKYAAHRIATFPVHVAAGEKKPKIRGWQKVGLQGSAKLAGKFANADAFGFCPGHRSGLTILDIDTSDERVLADALSLRGQTPIIIRSGSGKYQAWYRFNGEKRLIRPDPDKPIDILGGGFVVAPPSVGARSNYQFIQGDLDDLDRLPILRDTGATPPSFLPHSVQAEVSEGHRNDSLWRHCMQSALLRRLRRRSRCSSHAQCRVLAAVDRWRGHEGRQINLGLHPAWDKPLWAARRIL
jgi:hypothetical protein